MRKFFGLFVGLVVLAATFLPTYSAGSPSFPDLPIREPFREAILEMVTKRIISGYPDGTFKPARAVNRAEAAVMLVRTAGVTLARATTSPFADVPTTHWAFSSIITARNMGWIRGYPDGTFKPNNTINRSELSAMLVGARGLGEKAKKITERYFFHANDETQVPTWALGAVTLAYSPEHQFIIAREGSEGPIIAPLAPATREEVALSLWRAYLNHPQPVQRINLSLSSEPRILFVGFHFGEIVEHYIMDMFWIDGIDKWPQKGYWPGIFREIPSEENGLWKIMPDGKMVITFRIKPGLTYDDGVEITAKDFEFAHRVLNDPDIFPRPEPPNIERIETPDKYTVVTHWRRYDLNAYQGISYLAEHLVQPIYTEAKKAPTPEERLRVFRTSKFVRSPTATGWYRVKEWKAGAYILLEVNPEFVLNRKFGIKPLAQEVVVRILPDPAAVFSNFIRGVLDSASVDLEQAEVLRKTGQGYKIVTATSGMTHFWAFNTTSPFFRDKRVRQAMAYLTDREKVVSSLGTRFALSSVATSWIPPFTIGHTNSHGFYKFDPVKARALLTDAGWIDRDRDGILDDGKGNRASILFYFHVPSTFRETFAAFIRDAWREHGIEVRLLGETFAWSGSASRLQRGDYDIALWAFTFWDLEYPIIARNWFHKDYVPGAANAWGGLNRARWIHEEASTLIMTGLVDEMLASRRQTNWARLNNILADELPYFPIAYGTRAIAFRPGLYVPMISNISASLDVVTIPYWYYRR